MVSLGATGGVRCAPDGSPLGRRRADPADLLHLARADFEAVAAAYPALEARLRAASLARMRRACSPAGSPVRALGGSGCRESGPGPGSPGPAARPPGPAAARPERRRLSSVVAAEDEEALRAAEALFASLAVAWPDPARRAPIYGPGGGPDSE